MTILVLDASVLVAAAVDDGPEGRWAEQLIATDQLVAPHLALAETTNILRRLERAGRLSPGQADNARQDLLRLELELFPFVFSDNYFCAPTTIRTVHDSVMVVAASSTLPVVLNHRWRKRLDYDGYASEEADGGVPEARQVGPCGPAFGYAPEYGV